MRLSPVSSTLALGAASLLLLSMVGCGDDNNTSTTSSSSTTSTGGTGGTGGDGMGGMGTGGDGMGGMGTGGDGMGGMGAGGMGMGGMMLSMTQSVFVHGEISANGTDEVAFIDYPGNATPAVLTLMGLDQVDTNIQSIAVSPDGMRMAVGAEDTNAATVLYTYPINGMGAPTSIFDASNFPNGGNAEAQQVKYSPDGMWIAFRADLNINGANELWVSPVDGSTPPKLVSQTMATNDNDVGVYSWAPDSMHIAFVADPVTEDAFNLYVVDTTAAMPMPMEMIPSAMIIADQGVVTNEPAWNATGDRIYFKSEHETADLFRLYRVDPMGMNLEQVPGTGLMNGNGEASIGAWALSDDRMHLAFSSDSPTASLGQVYTMDLPAGTPAVVSNVTANMPPAGFRGPNFFGGLSWNPNNQTLAVIADWDVGGVDNDNDFHLFIVPASGNPGGVRILGPSMAANNMDVQQAGFSADGMRVFAIADLVTNNDTEFYSTTDLTTADQDPAGAQALAVPTQNGQDLNGFARLP